ncbi:MAG: sugar phosphate isomerase/epimerase family protein [Clostridia bacterium]|nr:sugar phosphate isomerase/epimerase family protein [Clostridia bacterium]
MRFGACPNMMLRQNNGAGFEYAERAKRAGYDYYELPLASLTGMDPAARREGLALMRSLGLPCYTVSSILPQGMRLLTEPTPKDEVEEYLKRALDAAAPFAPEVIVFGSAWAKIRPQEMPEAEAYERLAEFCRLLGDRSAEYGVTAVIEPNCRRETNCVKTFRDAVRLAKLAAHPNVFALSDYYHAEIEQEGTEDLKAEGAAWLKHAHFARIAGRSFPADLAEDAHYAPYFEALAGIGYAGGLTLEGKPSSPEAYYDEAVAALAFFREAAAKFGLK